MIKMISNDLLCTPLSIDKKIIIFNNYFESRNKGLTGGAFISSSN